MTENSPNQVTSLTYENIPDVGSENTETKRVHEMFDFESECSQTGSDSSSDESSDSSDGDSTSESSSDSDEESESDKFNLETSLASRPGSQCTVVVEVLAKSKKWKYLTFEGNVGEYFILYVANKDVCATIRLYRNSDRCKRPDIDEGDVYKFQSLTRLDESKRNESFLAPYNIRIKETYWNKCIPERLRKACKQIMYKPLWNSTRRRALNDAFYSEDESTITGKIVKV